MKAQHHKKLTRLLTLLLALLVVCGAVMPLRAAAQAPIEPFVITADDFFSDAAWNSDGIQFALAGTRGVWLFTDSMEQIAFLRTDAQAVSVSWNPSENQIAASFNDGSLRIWEWNHTNSAFELQNTIQSSSQILQVVSWSPDGSKLAAIGLDSAGDPHVLATIYVWSTDTWQPTNTTFPNYFYTEVVPRPTTLVWSPDSTRLAGAGAPATSMRNGTYNVGDYHIFVLDITSGLEVQSFLTADKTLAVAWSSNGQLAAGAEASVYVFDTNSGQRCADFPFIDASALDWASNSQILGYTNFENRSIEIRNLATNELYSVSYDGYALDTVDWHPYEAKILAVTGNRILVWDVSSLISTLPTDTPTYPPGAPSIESHTLQKIETIIQVSSDGKLLAK